MGWGHLSPNLIGQRVNTWVKIRVLSGNGGKGAVPSSYFCLSPQGAHSLEGRQSRNLPVMMSDMRNTKCYGRLEEKAVYSTCRIEGLSHDRWFLKDIEVEVHSKVRVLDPERSSGSVVQRKLVRFIVTLKYVSKNIRRKLGTRQGWRGCVGSYQYRRNNDNKTYLLFFKNIFIYYI